jgi:hypothetical protein
MLYSETVFLQRTEVIETIFYGSIKRGYYRHNELRSLATSTWWMNVFLVDVCISNVNISLFLDRVYLLVHFDATKVCRRI